MIFVALEDSPIFRLQSKQKMAHLLGVKLSDLRQIARSPEYDEWNEQKSDGGVRRIQHPLPRLKAVQKKIARLLSSIDPPEYLFCPVRGRSPFDNAVRHGGAKCIATIDIRSFFSTVAEARVVWFFKSYMGCSPDVAYLLTKLVTFNGHLPTGSPSSPIVSHFAYRDLWDEVQSLCQSRALKLSIWIDDLSISGEAISGETIWTIKQAIARFGLRYHPERRTDFRPSRITGVILHPDGSLALPHRHYKKVHAIKSEVDAATARADIRTISKLRGQLDGMLGQELQLQRIASATHRPARNVGGNEAGSLTKRKNKKKTTSVPVVETLAQA